MLESFRHEVRVAATLDHPNILPVKDASFIDGQFVIVMPLLVESFDDRLVRRLPRRVALDFFEQILSAVAYAHRHRIIHCDIKPGTFLIDSAGRVRLTDFGVAKVAQRTVKASGSGTVGYIAPEQAVGRPMFQSDVFSLGLLIYELFSGHVPEWPYTWPPPHIQRVRARLQPKLVEWLRRAIQVRPEDRYKNAVSMYREFRRLRNGSARKRSGSRVPKVNPQLWQTVLFRQFQRKYGKLLGTQLKCPSCTGPIAEAMQACPWCGTHCPARQAETRFPSCCPRCDRGLKLDWRYCPWCYGPGFEVEVGNRHYSDRHYSARCAHEHCRGPLMPFMRYCPWCHGKVKRPWPLPGSKERCPSCKWGVDSDFWHYCPWCTKAIAK
jgi:hypothetical protein